MNRDTTNLTRYVESASISRKLLQKADAAELRESISKSKTKLKESISETSEGWWVPISFYNKKNANGRIYNRKLWENVVNNQKDIFVGAPMLADHPAGDSDGTPMNICGIWLDAKIDPPSYNGEGLVYGLLVPSGRIGDDLKDHLSKGLKVGTSSSGFGKLLSDGVTVDPDSFVIERLSDWVLNPSQGTFFSYDEDCEDIVNQSRQKESVEIQVENMLTENIKEKFVKDSKIAKLEEKKFRRDMESFLEDASNIRDPQERLEEFKEIRSYLEEGACPDLKEKIEQKIAEEEAFIATALREKVELQEELQIESTKDLKEKLTKIVEDAAILNEEAKEWKSISEELQNKLQKVSTDLDSRPTNAYTSYLKERYELTSNKFKEYQKKTTETLGALTSHYLEANNKIKSLEEAVAELTGSNEILKEKLDSYKDLTSRVHTRLEESKVDASDFNLQLNESKNRIKSLIKIIESQKETIQSLETDNKALKIQHKKDAASLRKTSKYLERAEVKLSDIERAETEAMIEASKTPCDEYFESLYETYGNQLRPFERRIRNSRTLVEAKRYFFQEVLQNLKETEEINRDRIPESLYVDPEDRAKVLGASNFKKASSVDRRPTGWY